MNQAVVVQLDSLDENWSSMVETIEGRSGEIAAVKVTIAIVGRRRTGIASVNYRGSAGDAVTEATERAFGQAAMQFGVTIA